MRVENADDDGGRRTTSHVLGLEHERPDGIRALDLQPHRADALAARRPLGAHRHEGRDATLVARAPRLDALAQPCLLLRELLVELHLLRRLARQPLLLLAEEAW